MIVHFAWCDSFYDISSKNYEQDIVSIEISQKEGCLGVAKVVLKSKNITHKYARIDIEEKETISTIFRGKIISFPFNSGQPTMKIEILSEPPDFQEKLDDFCRKSHELVKQVDLHNLQDNSILYDNLFFSDSDKENPSIFLEGGTKLFYWNMSNGELALSDINRSPRNWDIQKSDIFQNSIRISFARDPYGIVNIRLSASWIQHISGCTDVIPAIARQFGCNYINSLTDICSAFKNVNKEGYSMLYNSMHLINPNTAGALTNFPISSADVKVKSGNEEKVMNFRRFYYGGKFILGWRYNQKRTENVTISLINSNYKRKKSLNINLQNIQSAKEFPNWREYHEYSVNDKVIFSGKAYACMLEHRSTQEFELSKWKYLFKISGALTDDSADSFFATNRGKNCIRYALQKAAALMNYSQRFVFINLIVDAIKFYNISIDSQITITDANNKKITAKVIQTDLYLSADSKILKITAGYAPNYSSDIFSKIEHYNPQITAENEKISEDIIKDIMIENPPEMQNQIISTQVFDSVGEVKALLRKFATKIKLNLRALNSKREIVRTIHLSDMEV
ncbi:MAG: hypothetical protein IJA14_02395 [Alphaproteobacteria bacterium]|nr:hypothetical protein [Alphaproteobacteria bacterium]